MAQEKKQVQDELRGLAVISNKKKKEQSKEEEVHSKKGTKVQDSVLGGPLEVTDAGFNVADMTLYARHLIKLYKESKVVDTFIARAKVNPLM